MRSIIARTCIAGAFACLMGGAALAQGQKDPAPERTPAQAEKRKPVVDVGSTPAAATNPGQPPHPAELKPRGRCSDAMNCDRQENAPAWSTDSTGANTMVENPLGRQPSPPAK